MIIRFYGENYKDKQLSNFLSMTIGRVLDGYMANLANKKQESKQKIALIKNEFYSTKSIKLNDWLKLPIYRLNSFTF